MLKELDSYARKQLPTMISNVNIKWNNSKDISVIIPAQPKVLALKMTGRLIVNMDLKRFLRY
jgi:hypothetical protein